MIHGDMKRYPNGRKKKYDAYSTKQRPVSTKTFSWGYSSPRGNSVDVKSLSTNEAHTTKPQRKEYTGTLVKGISTLHKSNAVPVLNKQEMKDHANMRR